MKIKDYKYEKKKKKWYQVKLDDPRCAKEYQKINYKENDKKGVILQVQEEWHNINQSIVEVTEEMTGGKKNTEMKNGMMTNVVKP